MLYRVEICILLTIKNLYITVGLMHYKTVKTQRATESRAKAWRNLRNRVFCLSKKTKVSLLLLA